MSNHSGSYMLNSILTMLDEEYNFLKDKTPKEVSNIFNKFDEIGSLYDTNTGEILEDIGAKYNICYVCLLPVKTLDDNGICPYCSGEDNTSSSVTLNYDDLEIKEEISNTSSWFRNSEFIVIHKPTGYTTNKYNRKSDAFDEVKRFLNNEFIHKY